MVVAEFDLSLSGAGLIWYSRQGDAEVALGVDAADLLFLGFGEDSFVPELIRVLGCDPSRTRTNRPRVPGEERGPQG